MTVAGGNPSTIAPPIGPFRHYTEVPPDHRLVFVSGQVGHDANGRLGPGCAEQSLQALGNLELILDDLGVGPECIVKLLTIVAGEGSWNAFSSARAEVFARWFPDGVYPAHSAFTAVELAAPDLKVEIEAVVAVPR